MTFAKTTQRKPLDVLLGAYPSSMEAVGHSERHDNRRNRACLKVLSVDNQALASMGVLVVHEAHEVAIIFTIAADFWGEDCLTPVSVGPVYEFGSDARFIVILHDAVEGEGAFSIEDARVNVARFMTGVVIIHASEIGGRFAECSFSD